MESSGQGRPDAAQQQRVVQPPPAADFFDPSLEWRRVFAETWGTFLLVLVAAGGGVVGALSGRPDRRGGHAGHRRCGRAQCMSECNARRRQITRDHNDQ
jgi:hypothetical protein